MPGSRDLTSIRTDRGTRSALFSRGLPDLDGTKMSRPEELMMRSTSHRVTSALLVAVGLGAGIARVSAQAPTQQTPPADVQLSALAPANLTKTRPAAPFNLTGNWFID